MFRTEVTPKISDQKISLNTSLITIGSCFSDCIGGLLARNKFDVLTNPFGIIFNPISICKLLNTAAKNGSVSSENWTQSQGVHLHYDVHSQLGSTDKKTAVENIDRAIKATSTQLQKTKWLINTWGTAIVYENKNTGKVVANRHKVPAAQFSKRVLTCREVIMNFEDVLSNLPANINILLTVSPVRHLKETLELNSISKSTLRIACHELSEKFDRVQYFPAYELLLDDLRDYRFYKSDMIHPSEEAIDYVWSKFSQTYFEESTLGFIQKWKKITTAINHKPFHLQSQAHQKFIRNTIKSINELEKDMDFSKEIKHLEQQLIK